MLEIKLFGAMSVTTPNGTVTASELGGVKPRQILEILAISPGIPVPKHQLADLLWDGCPPRSYVSTLESYLCALRRKLGLERGRVSAIRTTNHGYVLDPAAATTDLHEFRLDLAYDGKGPAKLRPAPLQSTTFTKGNPASVHSSCQRTRTAPGG